MEFSFIYFVSVRYTWSSAYVMLLILFSIRSVFYFGQLGPLTRRIVGRSAAGSL